jgi:hypothetical protein
MKKDLGLFPYKIQIHQPLNERSIENRFEFAKKIKAMIESKELDYQKIWFSDECHFDIQGYVNTQNYRIWGTEKPEIMAVRPLHPKRVTVWCAISYQGIIGPYFLSKSIDGQTYRVEILEKFFSEISRKKWKRGFWFMQDGARVHRTKENLDAISSVFGSNIIALDAKEKTGQGIDWPPYSPDLNPCDFSLWGLTKDIVYHPSQGTAETTDFLKERINETIKSIPDENRHKIIDHFLKRLEMVIKS